MAKMMDKDTILFTFKDKTSLAFNFYYLEENGEKHNAEIQNAENIYYKVTDERSTWINYRNAVATEQGTHRERINAALASTNYRVDIQNIPACTYVDREGKYFDIIPFDGTASYSNWVKRHQFDLEAVTYEIIDEDVKVTFKPEDDITNALLTLNGFFYEHEKLNKNTALFRNVLPKVTRIRTMSTHKADGYELLVKAYSWKNIKLGTPITFRCLVGLEFAADVDVPKIGIAVYKGVAYDYEVVPHNPKRIRLLGIPLTQLPLFEANKIKIYPFESMDLNHQIQKYTNVGIGNRYHKSVDFVLPVQDSLITFNGIDHEYEVTHRMAVMYPETLLSVTRLTRLSHIHSINFTKG